MLCLDTTFIIDLLKNNPDAIKKAKEIEQEQLFVTSVNIFEAATGIFIKKAKKELAAFESLTKSVDILTVNAKASFEAAKIRAQARLKGREMHPMDSLIAGCMKANHISRIVTRNKKHFEHIKGIKVECY